MTMKKKQSQTRAEFASIAENLRMIAANRGYRVDDTEEYFEIYSPTNPFPSMQVWKDDLESVTVKARIDDDDLFFEDQFDGFDNALSAFMLLDKTTGAIARQVKKNVLSIFEKLI